MSTRIHEKVCITYRDTLQMAKVKKAAATVGSSDVREKILETASALFYQDGIRAVGVDLVVEKAGVAKTSLYRYFATKDDLIKAFLERQDLDFWNTWDRVTEQHADDPRGELDAQMRWIGERANQPGYRGCPQLNVAAEFSEASHPARKVARTHKRELRRRLRTIAERLKVPAPDELAGQLAVLINGAFVSTPLFESGEAAPLLLKATAALLRQR